MSHARPTSLRPRRAAGRSSLIAALLLTLIAGLAPSAAQAGVEVVDAYAGPIATDRDPNPTINERYLCTPEPDGEEAYGTAGAFDPTQPIGTPTGRGQQVPPPTTYAPANMPSRADMQADLQAGASNDLCLGFRLTPNIEPSILLAPSTPNGLRYQNTTNPYPDVEETHVGPPAPSRDAMDRVVVDLPQGYLGSPDYATSVKCTAEQFGADNFLSPTCPAAAQAGTAFVRITTDLVPQSPGLLMTHLVAGGHPNLSGGQNTGGTVYLLESGPNELGRLGVSTQPVSGLAPAKFTVRLLFSPDGSGRIRTITTGAPDRLWQTSDIDGTTGQPNPGALPRPMYVESLGLRAWGKKADHPTLAADFGEWGTRCASNSATVSMTTYKGVTSQASSTPFTLQGCDQLPFDPSITVETSQRKPGVPTGAKFTVGLSQQTAMVGGEKVRSALLKHAEVKLPVGMEIGAQAGSKAGGLRLCTEEQFGKSTPLVASSCPAETKAGTVRIETPLIDLPFVGDIYLGAQQGVGTLPDLYLEVAPEGATAADAPRVKLVGKVSVNQENGQITTSFRDNPQLRFSKLELSFPDGPTALFTTPRACGTGEVQASFTPWSGQPAVDRTSSVTIDQDCETPGFQPYIGFAPSSPWAGATAPTTVSIARVDRSPWLKDLTVNLPAGFLANLKIVAECGNEQAWAGTCGDESRIGTVTTTAGAGEQPFALTGAIYLTSWQPPAVANTTIVVRAKVGDLDLGTVVVPGQIYLNPTNGSLSMQTSVPQRFQGLALNVRAVDVNLDRPGFALNPSACGPLGVSVQATGDGGQTGAGVTQVGYANCGALPFAPGIQASVIGEPEVGGHPEVRIDMATRPGDSNLGGVSVLLPLGIAPEIKNIQNRCSAAQFFGGACPQSMRVGTVMAGVSITDEIIYGDVFLVDEPGADLPGIGMAFNGRYVQRVLSTVRFAGANRDRLQTTFPAIPDLPLTKLSISLAGGPSGVLRRTTRCATPETSWDTTFFGQGGQQHAVKQTTGCEAGLQAAKNPTTKWSRKTGFSVSLSDFGGRNLRSAKLYLPKGLSFNAKQAKKKNAVRGSLTGAKASVKRRKTTLIVSTKTNNATKLSMKIKSSALKRSSKRIKKGKRYNVKLRLAFTDGTVQRKTVKIKAP